MASLVKRKNNWPPQLQYQRLYLRAKEKNNPFADFLMRNPALVGMGIVVALLIPLRDEKNLSFNQLFDIEWDQGPERHEILFFVTHS